MPKCVGSFISTLFCFAVRKARKMLSKVMWSPSDEANFALTAEACSRCAVELTNMESADRSATMLTISSLEIQSN